MNPRDSVTPLNIQSLLPGCSVGPEKAITHTHTQHFPLLMLSDTIKIQKERVKE